MARPRAACATAKSLGAQGQLYSVLEDKTTMTSLLAVGVTLVRNLEWPRNISFLYTLHGIFQTLHNVWTMVKFTDCPKKHCQGC